jgi:MFS family permease
MSQSTATRRRSGTGFADSRPLTGTNSVAFALSFLLIIGCVTDVQGVALLPLLGKMAEALHLSSAEVSWALNSSSVATAVMVGLSARSADIFGHRRVVIPMVALGVVGSVLCALAPSFGVLLVGRVIIGLCVCAPMSWAMLKIRADNKGLERAALWNGTLISIMTPLGLILGGLLLSWGASWSSYFWIVAFGYLVLLVEAILMPETPVKDRVRVPLDWVGSLGLGAWLVCLLLALSFGESWGWDSGAIIGLFVAAGVILVLWIMQQRRFPYPLMDFRGMDLRQVIAGYSVYCTVAMTASGLYILEPGLAETPSIAGYGFGASVLKASAALLPILPAAFIAAFISKPMLAKMGPRPPIAVGGILCVIAFTMMAFLHGSLWIFYLEIFIYGIGIIMAFNVGWALTSAAGRQDNMSTTFGIQYALAIPAAAVVTAVIIAAEYANVKPVAALGGAFVPKEGVYVAMFLMLAVISLVGYVINGLWIVPKHLRYQNVRLADLVAAEDSLEAGIPALPHFHHGAAESTIAEPGLAEPSVAPDDLI